MSIHAQNEAIVCFREKLFDALEEYSQDMSLVEVLGVMEVVKQHLVMTNLGDSPSDFLN